MNHYQSLGRADFKAKNYKDALIHFDRSIRQDCTVHVLDYRAACFEKLGDLPAALRDAKQQISRWPEDATGYLRASRVLLQMQRQQKAFERLKSIHDTLESELYPQRNLDPYTLLPRELAEHVMSYMSFKQRINLCLVSKQWMQFIRSAPTLWQHLDLSSARRRIRASFLSRAINSGRNTISEISLNGNCDTDKALIALLRHCPIRKITLSGTGPFSTADAEIVNRAKNLKTLCLGAGTEIRRQAFSSLMNGVGTQLQVFETHLFRVTETDSSFGRLEHKLIEMLSFTMTTNRSPTAPGEYGRLLALLPNVRSLRLLDKTTAIRSDSQIALLELASLPNLTILELEMPLLSRLLTLPPSLKEVKLCSTFRSSRSSFFDIITPTSSCSYDLPEIISLELRIPYTDWHMLDCFLHTGPAKDQECGYAVSKLRRLVVEIRDLPLKEEMERLLSTMRLRSIEDFALHTPHNHQSATDTVLETVLTCLPELKSLDLSQTGVTGIGVKSVVSNSHVKTLTLNNCYFIGTDAIDWARRKGLIVFHQLASADGRSGRIIQYG